MEMCNRCKKTIESEENYTDIVFWDMNDGEGSEVGESTICNNCHAELIKFLTNPTIG